MTASNKAYSGSLLRVAIWHEKTTWGNDVSTKYELPVAMKGAKVGEVIERLESAIAHGTRAEGARYDGKITATGLQFTVIAAYESIWQLVKLLCGTITNAGAGPTYTHSRTGFGALLAGFGAEIALVDPDTAANSRLYTCSGCQVTKMGIPLAGVAGQLEIPITFDAKTVVVSTGAPASATAYTAEPLILFNDQSVLTLDPGGGAVAMPDVVDASLEITATDAMIATANNSGRVGMRYRGFCKCRLTLNAILQSGSVYEADAIARTACTLVSTITTGSTAIWTVTLTNLKLSAQSISIGGATQVQVSCNGDCDAPTFAGTNTTASYPDPT